MTRFRALIAAAIAAAMALSACGGSSKPAYCSDRSDLQTSVSDLGKDVKSLNVSGIESQAKTVQSNATKLVNSAKGDFPSETSAIQSSVASLETSVKSLPKSPSASQVAAVGVDAKNVATAVSGFADATKSKCK